MTFAESPKSYSERDFEAKSCLLLAGPTATGEVGLKACADISQSEKSKASQMSTSDKVVALGGSLDTRNKLLDQETRSVNEIQNLLNEASEAPSSTYFGVADLEHFTNSLPNRITQPQPGLDSEYYFLGFLN